MEAKAAFYWSSMMYCQTPRQQRDVDPFWDRCTWQDLGENLQLFRGSIEWFYDSYVLDGDIERDLAVAAAAVAAQGD